MRCPGCHGHGAIVHRDGRPLEPCQVCRAAFTAVRDRYGERFEFASCVVKVERNNDGSIYAATLTDDHGNGGRFHVSELRWLAKLLTEVAQE